MLIRKNEPHILHLLLSEEKKQNFSKLLTLLRFVHKIYSSRMPKEEYRMECNLYKSRAIEFGQHLLTCYSYTRWSNYIHKTIEHVPEVIESNDTLGGFSGKGNETGNKIFHHMRKNHSRKTSTYDSVSDVLKMHWLYCSSKLSCKQYGHNCITCPSASKHKWMLFLFSCFTVAANKFSLWHLI